MLEKEVVKAVENSVAISAKGSVIYNDFSEFLPILKDLMSLNINQSQLLVEKKMENLEKYLEFLEKILKLQEKRIDFVEKSLEPDSMELLLDSMKKASLKGEKIDQATLASIVVTRLGTETNFTQLLYEQAYKIIVNLTPLQIKQIGSLYFFQTCNWSGIKKTESGLNEFYKEHYSILDLKFTIDTLNFLSGLGVVDWSPGFSNGQITFETLHKNRYGIDIENSKEQTLKYFYECYKKINGTTRLTTIGQVIGLEYLRGLISGMNFIEFLE